jgi:sn-glycerol 3-phosphate transport system ATP-binding protein
MKKIELVSVCKSYDRQQNIVNDLNVKIEKGEFFVLVGPSGCGKSTILRMIAGLESITKGDLLIDGVRVNDVPPSERQLAMVFQNYALYPHLNVEQNITFGLYTKKIKKDEQKRRCIEASQMLGLESLLQRKPRELSGGQRQRVALARAIVTQSPICLMDEPLSNLDAKLRAKMRSEIRQLQRQLGMTMIYVTHDQVEAMTMADRMMVLHNGHIQQIGRPLDIYNNPNNTFVATFIGSPPMNIAYATVSSSDFHLEDGETIHIKDRSVNQDQILIGIRPESIQLKEEHPSFYGKVENVEVLGTETLVKFSIGTSQWIARWNGQWNIRIGEILPLFVKDSDWFFFDPESGQRLEDLKIKEKVSVL